MPDIVSIAKSTGNGYPLGAVITSRAVAEGFRSQGYFFSSTGGSPLSCAIGITVLDTLRDEELQENAVARRRTSEVEAAGASGQGIRSSAPCTASGSTSESKWSATRRLRARAERDVGDLRSNAGTRGDHPADRRSHEHPEDQAAVVH